jgi:hypothetical protein
MSFKDGLAEDAGKVFLNSSEFAEDVIYTPKGASPLAIKAVVNRRRLDPAYEDTGRTLLNQAEIFIANDASLGVVSINKGQDTVSFAETLGGAVISWVVADILNQDEGMWHLLVQK